MNTYRGELAIRGRRGVGGTWALPILIMACALALASCLSSGREPDFFVSGTVRDARTGAPLAGVRIGDGSYGARPPLGVTSAADGTYGYFTWYEEHDIVAEAPGYRVATRVLYTRFFGRSPVERLDFVLEPLD